MHMIAKTQKREDVSTLRADLSTQGNFSQNLRRVVWGTWLINFKVHMKDEISRNNQITSKGVERGDLPLTGVRNYFKVIT